MDIATVTVPNFNHTSPTFRTFCGANSLSALPRELDRLGVSRVVIFCGASLERNVTALERIQAAIGGRLAGQFSGVQAHSPLPAVEAGRRFLKDVLADAVIAVGGGSAVVTARAAAVLFAEGRDIRELCTQRDANGTLFSPKLTSRKIPLWVVPSTPTTAYAKAGSAVLDPDTGERLALYDPKLRAQGIFLDPEVALTASLSLFRSSGLNAFSMAIEALLSGDDDPLADASLIHALRMLIEWLPRLMESPEDVETRLRLMLAALLCGEGTDHTGGSLAQGLAHAAGPRSSVANGIVEVLLLPHAIRFIAPAAGEGVLRIGDALGVSSQAAGTTLDKILTVLEGFLAAAEIPRQLRDVGIPRSALMEIADHAIDDWFLVRLPRRPSRNDILELLERAW